MRFKNRYYLVEIIWEAVGGAPIAAAASSSSSSGVYRITDVSIQSYQLQSALREAMLNHFGEWGLSRVLQSLQVRYLNSLTNLAIIRVARADSRTLAALIAFLTQLKQKQLLLRTIHLSGTIRSCQKRALIMQRQRLQELEAQIHDLPEHAAVSNVLQVAAKQNPPQRSAQQTLNQLAALLSQYNAAKTQQAAAATSHTAALAAAAGAGAGKLAKSEHTVVATADSIQAAIQQIEQKGTEEIMAIDS